MRFARIVFAAALAAGTSDAAEIGLSAAQVGGPTLCSGVSSGLGRCPAPLTGSVTQIAVTIALGAPAALNGYDLNVGWDPGELALLAAEQLYPDAQPPGTIPFLVAPNPSNPTASEAVTLSLVPYATTTLVRLTFQTTQAASQMAGDCQADVWWTANGNGLSPAGVVLANPQGSAIDIGNFTVCTDGIDNDGDGKFDFDGGLCGGLAVPTAPDPQCSIPGALAEAPSGCGGGYELALVILPIAGWRRRR